MFFIILVVLIRRYKDNNIKRYFQIISIKKRETFLFPFQLIVLYYIILYILCSPFYGEPLTLTIGSVLCSIATRTDDSKYSIGLCFAFAPTSIVPLVIRRMPTLTMSNMSIAVVNNNSMIQS